jgi:hypothetical protein
MGEEWGGGYGKGLDMRKAAKVANRTSLTFSQTVPHKLFPFSIPSFY